MLINGQKTPSDDMDALIELVKASPSPFENRHVPASAKPAPAADEKSHPVGQGQVGYSAIDPIGTKHVAECVAMLVRDPVSGKVACAHIDQFSTVKSIESILDGMAPSGCQVMLLGARFAEAENPEYARRKEPSMHNIRKVLGVLQKRDVDIVAAQIQDEYQLSEIHVDPVSFRALKKLPFSPDPDPDMTLVFAKMILTGGRDTIDLETVFDGTVSPARNPLLLRAVDIEALDKHVHGKADHEIGDWFRGREGFRDEDDWISICTSLAKAFDDDYRQALDALAAATGQDKAAHSKKPLYVGQGALDANLKALKAIPQAGSSPSMQAGSRQYTKGPPSPNGGHNS